MRQAQRDEMALGAFIHRSQLASSATASGGDEGDGGDNKRNKSTNETDAHLGVIDPSLIEKTYKPSTQIESLRVLGYHLVEGLLFASNRPDLLIGSWGTAAAKASGDESEGAAVVHASSVVLGEVYDVTVQNVHDFGLVVQIGSTGNVQGVCPSMHLSDTSTATYDKKGKLKMPPPSPKLYKKGMKLRMRVWEKDGSSILLTNKKSLISIPTNSQVDGPSTETEERLLLSYTKVRVGQVVTGVISKISATDGITVHYANKVKALLPMVMLVKQGVVDPLEAYRVGQVVKAVIISTKGLLSNAKTDENKGSRVFRLVAALNIGKLSSILKIAQSLGLSSSMGMMMMMMMTMMTTILWIKRETVVWEWRAQTK